MTIEKGHYAQVTMMLQARVKECRTYIEIHKDTGDCIFAVVRGIALDMYRIMWEMDTALDRNTFLYDCGLTVNGDIHPDLK